MQLNNQLRFYKTDRLALVQMTVPAVASAKEAYIYFEQMRKQLKSRFSSASSEFIKSPNTDFELIVTEIYKRAGPNIKPSFYVAAATKFFEMARDPHTSMRPTKELQMASNENGASFVGIGIEFVKLEQGLMVKRVLKGSGSAAAGVLVGDVVTAVDSKVLKGLSDEEMVPLMRGVENTSVKLTVHRGSVSRDLTVIRKKVVNPVVSSESVNLLYASAASMTVIPQLRKTPYDPVKDFEPVGTTVSGINGDDAGADEGAIRFTELTGVASITGCNISGAVEHNVQG